MRWVAVIGDRTTPRPEDVVGRGMLSLPQKGNTHLAVVYVGVHPEHRGRGIGAALWEVGERAARETGRTVIMSDSSHSPEPPPGPGTIESSTGSGRVPADDAGVRFALARGFALEQVARHSVLDLPVAPERLVAFRERAQAAAGDDYRTLTWQDEVPEEWLDQVAILETRMSTDPPDGGLDLEEDPWDAERVRATSQQLHDRGHGYLITAVEHVPTATLAGFTMVAYPLARPEVVFQEDTLVLEEHRGHSLGAAREDREPPGARPGAPVLATRPHLERAGEQPHAGHQRGPRLRAVERRRRVAAQARLSPRGSATRSYRERDRTLSRSAAYGGDPPRRTTRSTRPP